MTGWWTLGRRRSPPAVKLDYFRAAVAPVHWHVKLLTRPALSGPQKIKLSRSEGPVGLSPHLVVSLLGLRNEIRPGRREDVDHPAIDLPDVPAVRDV